MKSLVVFALSIGATAAISAATLNPVAYDLNNGHGVASSGAFNYWDKEYAGLAATGNTSLDNDFLTGGLGNLTDGSTSNQNWFDAESGAGTGPYVGWRSGVLPDLSVLFRFNGAQALIDTISVHADDSSGAGGVNLPDAVTFTWSGGSFTRAVVDPDAGPGPSWLVFGNLGITNAQFVRVGFAYSNEWVFVDEVVFTGTVPEPGTYALLAAGLFGVGVAVRRRRVGR